jgi:hypothetical protein
MIAEIESQAKVASNESQKKSTKSRRKSSKGTGKDLEPKPRKSRSKSNRGKSPKSHQIPERRAIISLEQQLDMLPQLQEPILCATSMMSKNFIKETEALTKTATAFDPVLVDSECVFRPKVDKRSERMAQNARRKREEKLQKFMVSPESLIGTTDLRIP